MGLSPFVGTRAAARGLTLVELLIATVLSLILMTAATLICSRVVNGISNSRMALEQFDRLRAAEAQLRQDLSGVTATMLPPRRAEAAEGYFEVIQGSWNDPPAADYSGNIPPATLGDTTVGRRGDILMFTTRSTTQPFTGRLWDPIVGVTTTQSYVAEVAWFIRGRTLHRRILLVAPGVQSDKFSRQAPGTFFRDNDISARRVNGFIYANSLGDLAKREWRFAHPANQFPYDASQWGLYGLPTLRECSSNWMSGWSYGTTPKAQGPGAIPKVDMWGDNPSNDSINIAKPNPGAGDVAYKLAENALGDGDRKADDVVLTNVIGFDVRLWDSKTQQYVYLHQAGGAWNGDFSGGWQPALRTAYTSTPACQDWQVPTYDTWPQSYDSEGIYYYDASGPNPYKIYRSGVQVPPGQAGNGFDDDQTGVVDDDGERCTSPPYPLPLRGIQVKIRVFEPSSRQVREVTIKQDFLPK